METDRKIIYAVSRGTYSDYCVLAVFSEKELAEAYIEAFDVKDLYGCGMDIEEFDLNPFTNEIRLGYKQFFVRMSKNGRVITIREEDGAPLGDGIYFDIDNNMYCYVLAKDREHAIKIANERRAQAIAENRWNVKP